jgi:hypothetical protein
MDRLLTTVCTVALLVSSGCASQSSADSNEPAARDESAGGEPAAEERTNDQAVESGSEHAAPKEAWIEKRVEESRERLTDSEAGKLIWKSIEAHGGLERWFANGPLFFRFDYSPIGDRTVRDTYNLVDTWASRARQELADDRDRAFGWTGEQAWFAPKSEPLEKINARFWALTPYYFVGMPFVLSDPGVKLEMKGTAELHGETHQVVKATFAEGTGDSPDDYYTVYIDPETGRFGGLRYIVTYPGFFPDGGHSPPKLMVYNGEQTVDGITFAETAPAYKWNKEEGERGEKVTEISISDVEFRPETPDAAFDVPEDGKIQAGY